MTSPAIIDGDRVIDHAELGAIAGAWAATLAARGVRRGDRVAMLALGCAEVFVIARACARLGAAFAPLSWRLAPPELSAIVRDLEPRVLVCDRAHVEVAADLDTERLVLDEESPPGDAPPWDAHDPEAIAQILYTSGTTGRPRGAMIPWRQVSFNAAITRALCNLGPRDRTLAMLPLFHTGGLNCLSIPVLAGGGAIVVMPRFDPAAAIELIVRHRVSAILGVPAIYEALLDAGLSHAIAPWLRVVLVGGAPVSPSLRACCAAQGLPLKQGFGMTEVGPNCFTFGDDDVGRPVPGTEAILLEPKNGVGELCLRGRHVFAGYLGQPTDELFVHDRWFRTGDLMARDVDGRYRVVGRVKDMFISGGENVYPGEVEAVLAAHPQIAEVAVIGVADERWGEVGLAAIVARAPLGADELDAWTRARLARYKVPRHWRFVPTLPRTPTGKIARAELVREAT
ncbi:MAG TPA: AMP-binding protein [Kofleriaceae bacterium]|nr:AMP-binding protein [Kofleriaceae bacterium]